MSGRVSTGVVVGAAMSSVGDVLFSSIGVTVGPAISSVGDLSSSSVDYVLCFFHGDGVSSVGVI